MAEWFQVYADESARVRARGEARRVAAVFAALSGALMAAALAATLLWPGHATVLAVGCGGGLTFSAAYVMHRLGRLHARVWRVDLSARRLVAHDAGGHHTSLSWAALDQVDVCDEGLVLSGRAADGLRVRLHVAGTLPEFAALSHRTVEYAEAFRRPVCVDGKPWEALDLDAIYPSLRVGSAPEL